MLSSQKVVSKTRLAPIKQESIPRLELLSCLIFSRLMCNVRDVLKNLMFISDELYLSDSEIAPRNAGKGCKQYIQKRVSEIRKLSSGRGWYQVRGKENIADLPSQGCSIRKLALKKKWIEGSLWLKDKISG